MKIIFRLVTKNPIMYEVNMNESVHTCWCSCGCCSRCSCSGCCLWSCSGCCSFSCFHWYISNQYWSFIKKYSLKSLYFCNFEYPVSIRLTSPSDSPLISVQTANTINKIKPGHSDISHSPASVDFPGHCSSPPKRGSPHARALSQVPGPQVALHSDHWPQSCHSAAISAISF